MNCVLALTVMSQSDSSRGSTYIMLIVTTCFVTYLQVMKLYPVWASQVMINLTGIVTCYWWQNFIWFIEIVSSCNLTSTLTVSDVGCELEECVTTNNVSISCVSTLNVLTKYLTEQSLTVHLSNTDHWVFGRRRPQGGPTRWQLSCSTLQVF